MSVETWAKRRARRRLRRILRSHLWSDYRTTFNTVRTGR